MRRSRAAVALLVWLAGTGCASSGPPSWPSFEPLTGEAAVTQSDPLPSSLRAGIAWTEDWLGDPRTYVDHMDELHAHQESLLGAVGAALSSPPLTEVVPLRRRSGGERGAANSLASLATAGAEAGVDLVIVLRTRSEEEVEANGFSPLYLLLVTTPLVPGYDLRVAAIVQLCALDVDSNRVLTCATEQAETRERFVTPLGTRSAHRRLRLEALQTAITGASEKLSRDLRRRVHAAPRVAPGP